MSVGLIALLVVLALVVLLLGRSVRIVPQARAAVIERLGRYVRTAGPGLTVLVPFVDRMRPLMDLREQVVSFPPQPVITSDNLTVAIDSVIYFQVTDPRSASYEIQNYIQAVEQLTITTLRNVVGSLNLEQALTSRDAINTQLRVVLDEATGPWGIRVARVEIKAIDPPPSIRDAMEQQMRADRNKRAIILQAEGQRESSIKSAEGQKASQILEAEGQKQAVILAAEAERQSRILRAEGDRAARFLTAQGQAKAIETTFAAIHDSKPDPAVMAYQYLQTLPQIAQGDANKMWIVPSEYGKALEGLGRLAAPSEEGHDAPSWMQVGDGGERTADKIDTDGWFDSNLPPAADLPERANLRASDSDPATQEAHDALAIGPALTSGRPDFDSGAGLPQRNHNGGSSPSAGPGGSPGGPSGDPTPAPGASDPAPAAASDPAPGYPAGDPWIQGDPPR
ncbi:MAG: SPFH/Band 7/PHB domain protein [Actinomycetota bacterium]|nr:SPFH/Band 7/PHB domain protein [Actinomycetota bacterium]